MVYAQIFTVSRFSLSRSFQQTSSHRISTLLCGKSISSNSNSTPSRFINGKRRSTNATNEVTPAIKMASAKKVKKKPVNHSSLVSCYLQVISSGSSEQTPSLYLFTDNRRFVFNCGENFQRFIHEHHLRVLKDIVFFITRVAWRNLGGFTGAALACRDIGSTHLNVYGPGRLAQFVELVRYFVGRERLKLVTNWDCPDDVMTTSPSPHVYSDENVTITLVELEPKSVAESDNRTNQKAKNVDETSPLDDGEDIAAPEPKRIKHNEDHSPLPCSTAAYICKVSDVRGKFNVARARELGLKQGLMYKKLASGESVTAPNGRVVHPSDVLGEPRLGPTFIVIECPDRKHISAVTSHPKLQKEYFSSTGQEMALVVHFSPLEVLQDDEYCKWAASFGESTRHLLLNESVCPTDIALRASLRIQYPLYLMNPNVHHPPPIFKDGNPESIDLKLSKFFSDPKKSIILGRSLLKFHLKPKEKMGEDISQILQPIKDELHQHLDEIESNNKLTSAIATGLAMSMSEPTTASGSSTTKEYSVVEESTGESLVHPTCSPGEEKVDISDLTNNPAGVINDIISDAKPKPEEEAPANSNPVDGRLFELCSDPKPRTCDFQGPDDAIVTFLGTASTEPSKYRNVSGILIHTPNSGNFILDCGEGSLSQIYRCFPEEIADDIIINLKAIFLSHVHADHHLGTMNVLQKREQLLAAKKAEEDKSMASMDSATSDCHDDVVVIAPAILTRWISRYGELIEKLPCKLINCHTLTKGEIENDPMNNNSAAVADLRFETVRVIHCFDAYGVVVRHATGWSVVYSGDTRPCSRLIEAGQGASLLIHEATLEDKFLDLAIAKKHCTVSEALDVSDKMTPEFTILTHFSQRDPKIPSFLMTNQQLHSRVVVAMDCMSVNLKQLDQLPRYLPIMRDIFTEVAGED